MAIWVVSRTESKNSIRSLIALGNMAQSFLDVHQQSRMGHPSDASATDIQSEWANLVKGIPRAEGGLA